MVDPTIALTISIAALLAAGLLFWPERGLYFLWKQHSRLSQRVLIEDILKHVHKFEMKGRPAAVESAAGAAQVSMDEAVDLIAVMERRGLLRHDDGLLTLTSKGRDLALHVLRTHRLWERYLAEQTGYHESEWHLRAEEAEHRLSPQETEDLSAQLGNPTHDPHGDPIPTAQGRIYEHGGQSLNEMPLDRSLKIVHLEDEPPAVYAQLTAEGLHLGGRIRILERTPERIRFWANGNEVVLAPVVAANISVVEAPDDAPVLESTTRCLSDLELGQSAVVSGVSPACRGLERRRFLDLGILPGTPIAAEMISPGGDPTAYRVRGSLIALRRDQARHIHVIEEGVAADVA